MTNFPVGEAHKREFGQHVEPVVYLPDFYTAETASYSIATERQQAPISSNVASPSPITAATALAVANNEITAEIKRRVSEFSEMLAQLVGRLTENQSDEHGAISEADCILFLEVQYRTRRIRMRHLPDVCLGEPAWDILLDLAIAHYRGRETSVTSLCIGADVPTTTALRWINSMTNAGLIVRRPCIVDKRRNVVAIAPSTYQAVLQYAVESLRAIEKMRARYQSNAREGRAVR